MDCHKLMVDMGYDESSTIEYLMFVYTNQSTEKSGTEKHHILPRSIFPEHAKTKSNIARLSAKDHFIAHYMLCGVIKSKKMLWAFNQMQRVITENKELHELAVLYSEYRASIYDSFKLINIGRKRSEESIRRQSERMIGTILYKNLETNEHKQIKKTDKALYESSGWANAAIGRKRTQESKNRMSEKSKGRKAYTDGNRTFWFTDDQTIPDHLTAGVCAANLETLAKIGKQNGSLKFYTNKLTGEQKRLRDDDVTSDWENVRTNFGNNGNPFIGTNFYVYLLDRNVKKTIEASAIPPDFYVHASKKYVHFWKSKNLLISNVDKFSRRMNIKMKQVRNLIEAGEILQIDVRNISPDVLTQISHSIWDN